MYISRTSSVTKGEGAPRRVRVWAAGTWTHASITLAQPSDVQGALRHITSCAKQSLDSERSRSAIQQLLRAQENKLSAASTSAGGVQHGQGTNEQRALLAALKQAELLMRSIEERSRAAVAKSRGNSDTSRLADSDAPQLGQLHNELHLVAESLDTNGAFRDVLSDSSYERAAETFIFDGVAYNGIQTALMTDEQLYAVLAISQDLVSFALLGPQDKHLSHFQPSHLEMAEQIVQRGVTAAPLEGSFAHLQAWESDPDNSEDDEWERISAASSTSIRTKHNDYVSVSVRDAESGASPQPSQGGSVVVCLDQLREDSQRLLVGSHSGASTSKSLLH